MKQTTKIIATLAVTLAMATPAISATQTTTEKKAEPAKINVIKIPAGDVESKNAEATKAEPAKTNTIKIPVADAEQKKSEPTPAKKEVKPAVQPAKPTPAKTEAKPVAQPAKTAPAKTETKPVAEPAKAAPAKAEQTTQNKPTQTTKKEETKAKTNAKETKEAKSADTSMANREFFVTVEWLKKNIKSCIVIDCRPNSLYKSGHIPGAINAEWTYFAKINVPNGTEKWGTMLPPETLSKRIGALGINGTKPVVVYCDDKGWGQSGWALWVLRQTGLKKIYELDGGYTEWKQHGGVVSKQETKAKPVSFKATKYLPGYTIDTATLKDKLQDYYIIDVRTKAEYDGKIRPFQEKRAGHIPGSVNIEKDETVDIENIVQPKEFIDKLLLEHGIGKDKPIVVYDTAGVRSAFVTMVLRHFGYNAINYDAGFQAWAGNANLPVEK